MPRPTITLTLNHNDLDDLFHALDCLKDRREQKYQNATDPAAKEMYMARMVVIGHLRNQLQSQVDHQK